MVPRIEREGEGGREGGRGTEGGRKGGREGEKEILSCMVIYRLNNKKSRERGKIESSH